MVQLELIKTLRSWRKDSKKDSDDEDSDSEKDKKEKVGGLADLQRLRRRVVQRPGRVIQEYTDAVKERLGITSSK